jgi:hypothetical protein
VAGLAAVVAYLQVWRLFGGIGLSTSLVPAVAGIAGVAVSAARLRRLHPTRRELVAVAAAGAGILWLANRALGETTGYDTALYHFVSGAPEERASRSDLPAVHGEPTGVRADVALADEQRLPPTLRLAAGDEDPPGLGRVSRGVVVRAPPDVVRTPRPLREHAPVSQREGRQIRLGRDDALIDSEEQRVRNPVAGEDRVDASAVELGDERTEIARNVLFADSSVELGARDPEQDKRGAE